MPSTLLRGTGLALLVIGAAAASACAEGGTLPATGGAGGGLGGNGTGLTTTSSTSHSTSSSSGTTSSTSGTTSSSTSSTTTSSTTTSSSTTTTPNGCVFGDHKCNGVCVGNTPETGCYTSVTCAPCLVPSNGSAVCSTVGICDIQCNTGYLPNASKTSCDAIPPPTECCDTNDCPIFLACLAGWCQNPFGSICDPPRCTQYCQTCNGGTPSSTGQCYLDVIVWDCQCTL